MIILISSSKDLEIFGIKMTAEQKKFCKQWPSKTSIVFECDNKKMEYLHRGKKSLAFRVPENKWLKRIIKKAGPLSAPSANIEGKSSAETIEEAIGYFKDSVSLYVDGGKIKRKSSKIISFEKGKIETIRK